MILLRSYVIVGMIKGIFIHSKCGISNLPGLVAADASALYARNLMTFLNLMLDPKNGEFVMNREDEVIAGTLVCAGGEVVRKT